MLLILQPRNSRSGQKPVLELNKMERTFMKIGEKTLEKGGEILTRALLA